MSKATKFASLMLASTTLAGCGDKSDSAEEETGLTYEEECLPAPNDESYEMLFTYSGHLEVDGQRGCPEGSNINGESDGECQVGISCKLVWETGSVQDGTNEWGPINILFPGEKQYEYIDEGMFRWWATAAGEDGIFEGQFILYTGEYNILPSSKCQTMGLSIPWEDDLNMVHAQLEDTSDLSPTKAVWKSAVVDGECVEAEFNAAKFVVELTTTD